MGEGVSGSSDGPASPGSNGGLHSYLARRLQVQIADHLGNKAQRLARVGNLSGVKSMIVGLAMEVLGRKGLQELAKIASDYQLVDFLDVWTKEWKQERRGDAER